MKRRNKQYYTALKRTVTTFAVFTAMLLVIAVKAVAKEPAKTPVVTVEPIPQATPFVAKNIDVEKRSPEALPNTNSAMSATEAEVARVTKQFESDDVSVPILIDYIGMWVDQRGVKMLWTDAKRYFDAHPDYCAAIVAANRKLNNHPATDDRPGDEYEKVVELLADYGDAKGKYPFINERIAEFCEDGTYLLMAMSPNDTETVQKYMDWTGYNPELVPVYRSSEGWIDQFGDQLSSHTADEVFKRHPEYQEIIEDFSDMAQKTGLSEFVNIKQAQIVYNQWFMSQARQENGITEADFHSFGSHDVIPTDQLWNIDSLIQHFAEETVKLANWHRKTPAVAD